MKMEMESAVSNTEAVASKLWNLVRAVFYTLKKGILSKTRLYLLLKRTNKLAGKAISSFLLLDGAHHHHHSSFSCKSSNDAVFTLAPTHYEFSCSNTPLTLRRTKLHHRSRHRLHAAAANAAAVKQVLELINGGGSHCEVAPESPEAGLPGLSPAVGCRQLRVTDSPFPARESEEETVAVNKAADEFITNFYNDLRRQRSLGFESPYRDTWIS